MSEIDEELKFMARNRRTSLICVAILMILLCANIFAAGNYYSNDKAGYISAILIGVSLAYHFFFKEEL